MSEKKIVGRRTVARLLGDIYQGQPSQFATELVLLQRLVVLRQTRVTFELEYIRQLASNIESVGMLEPPIVVCYGPENFRRYLEALNEVWGTDYRAEDYSPTETKDGPRFYVLVAGECRTRAARELGWRSYEAKVAHDIDPIVCLWIQNAENGYKAPPIHEQAYAWQRLWTVVRRADAKFPLAAFARHIGKAASTVTKGLRFCGLPDQIQFAVREGTIEYGLATQLARLQGRVEDAELFRILTGLIVKPPDVKSFQAQVSRRLLELSSGQADFLVATQAVEDMRRQLIRERRRTLGHRINQHLDLSTQWVIQGTDAFAKGLIGLEYSPVGSRSLRRRLQRLTAAYRGALGLIRATLGAAEAEKFWRDLRQGERLVQRADEVFGDFEELEDTGQS